MHPSFGAVITTRKYNQPTRVKPLLLTLKLLDRKLTKIGRNKSVGPDGVPGEILKLGGEAITPFVARLLEILLNNASFPSDCKKAIVVPTRVVPKVMSNFFFLHANWEQQTKESAVVDGTSCCVILECLMTSIACIT